MSWAALTAGEEMHKYTHAVQLSADYSSTLVDTTLFILFDDFYEKSGLLQVSECVSV